MNVVAVDMLGAGWIWEETVACGAEPAVVQLDGRRCAIVANCTGGCGEQALTGRWQCG